MKRRECEMDLVMRFKERNQNRLLVLEGRSFHIRWTTISGRCSLLVTVDGMQYEVFVGELRDMAFKKSMRGG